MVHDFVSDPSSSETTERDDITSFVRWSGVTHRYLCSSVVRMSYHRISIYKDYSGALVEKASMRRFSCGECDDSE